MYTKISGGVDWIYLQTWKVREEHWRYRGWGCIQIIGIIFSAQKIYPMNYMIEWTRRRKYPRKYRGRSANILRPLPLGNLNLQKQVWKNLSFHGESGKVKEYKIKRELYSLHDIIYKYNPHNLFNMEKTGYLFKIISKRGYICKKQIKHARGFQKYEIQGTCYSLHIYKLI